MGFCYSVEQFLLQDHNFCAIQDDHLSRVELAQHMAMIFIFTKN